MVETGRYRVHNYNAYNDRCSSSIPDVDIIYVGEVNGDELEIEEVDNKRGAGASNTVSRSDFESLVNGGYIERAQT